MTTCTVLTQRLHNLHQEDPANLAEMAAHIRACARCRRGQIALPPGFGLPVYLTLDHGARQPTLALYYEATHPEYPLAQLGDREVVATALHLALCPMCRDQFEALCQASEVEEQGNQEVQEE